MAERTDMLVVLGMHRSGTSALAGLLHAVGARLGQTLLEPQPGVNAGGFWENARFVALHEAVHQALGSAWYDFRPLPDGWWKRDDLEALRQSLDQAQREEFAGHRLCAVKDPRLCRLLPLWSPYLESESLRAACILVVRHPFEIARSLALRDGIDEIAGLSLWLTYCLEAEYNTRRFPCEIVYYDAVLADPRAVLSRLSAAFDVGLGLNGSAPMQVEAFIDSGLKHHHAAGDDRAAESAIGSLSLELFEAFGLHGPARRITMDRIGMAWRSLLGAADEIPGALFRTLDASLEKGRQLSDLGERHTHALRVVAERDQQLEKTHRQLSDLGEQHAHALHIVRARDQQVEQLNEAKARLEAEHATAVQQLQQARERLEGNSAQLREALAAHHEANRSFYARVTRRLAHAVSRAWARRPWR